MSQRPYVLLVDDKPDDEARGIAQQLQIMGVDAESVHPADLMDDHLMKADLLLVDYELDQSNWDQSDLPLANQCENGWALSSTLRWKISKHDHRPTPATIALLTNQIGDALDPFSTVDSHSVVASLNGIEWVFDKREADLAPIKILSEASLHLRSGLERAQLEAAIAMPSGTAHWADLLSSGIPVSELLRWHDGVAVIRWLLQRVFPYPCFLIDEHFVAARLGIAVRNVEALLARGGELGRAIDAAMYRGVLAGFSGRRWWSRSIEDALWGLTEGRSTSLLIVRELVAKELELSIAEITEGGLSPVVTLDESLAAQSILSDAADCMRVRPNYWPSYAADAWARVEDVKTSDQLQRIALESWEAG
jgi:hypothetical protein